MHRQVEMEIRRLTNEKTQILYEVEQAKERALASNSLVEIQLYKRQIDGLSRRLRANDIALRAICGNDNAEKRIR